MNIKEEIFSVGRWNGMEFTLNDLRVIANSFHSLKEVLRVPLKLGHNEDQPITDGQPALGWITDVYVQDDKLIAEFSDVPSVVFDSMQSKLYTQKSIELDFDVSHKGIYYQMVLTGVALLGADLPAVNNLNDLTAYHATKDYESKKRMIFTLKEDRNMSDDFKSQLEKAQAELAKLMAEKESQKMEFERATKEMKDVALKEKEDAKKELFSRDKAAFEAELEMMVKDQQILPAQRDELIKDIDNDAILETRKYTAGMIKLSSGSARPGKVNDTTSGTGNDSVSHPDALMLLKIKEVQQKSPDITFARAKRIVFDANPKLAKEYANMNL